MKTQKLLAFLAAGLLSLNSCKKGEEDPFMSLKSRDARITGTWELSVSSSESKSSSTYDGTTTETTSSSIYADGRRISTYGGSVDTTFYTMTMDINKDGTTLTKYNSEFEKEEESGNWWWSNDTKKKTGIVFDGSTYDIERLAKDELILIDNSESSGTHEDGSSHASSNSYRATFIKKK
jgi:hypothetical protein